MRNRFADEFRECEQRIGIFVPDRRKDRVLRMHATSAGMLSEFINKLLTLTEGVER
jgi:hypothetical protein